MSRSYRVSFFRRIENGKGEEALGTNVVDVHPFDRLCLETKAFRQATPNQQTATRIQVQDMGAWGTKRSAAESIEKKPVQVIGQPKHRPRLNMADPKDRLKVYDAAQKIVASMGEDLKKDSGRRHAGKERFKGRSGAVAK